MERPASPIDIARQALRQLALQKTPPTPDNFRRAYDEVAGVKSASESKQLGELLHAVLLKAGRKRPKYITAAKALAEAIDGGNWAEAESQLAALFPAAVEAEGRPVNWGGTLRELLKELEVSRKGLTTSKKKEGLERVLANFDSDADLLLQKLDALVGSWRSSSLAAEDIEIHAPAEEVVEKPAALSTISATMAAMAAADQGESLAYVWRDLLLKTLEFGVISQLKYLPELSRMASTLINQAKAARSERDITRLTEAFRDFWFRLEINSSGQYRLHEELLHLLRLLVENISELVVDDKWLYGQTQVVRDIIAKPLNIEVLYDAESNLKELIFKQRQLQHSIAEAKAAIKQMAAIFVVRLSEMTGHTGTYHQKIEHYQEQIKATEDITELNKVIDSLMQDTRAMQLDALRVHDELKDTQVRVQEAEERILKLTTELEQISEAAHLDHLTGILNRRGMDDAMQREFSRAERGGTPLCIALMDVDHFKKLNDTLGHDAGDVALIHLARVTKEALRPTDVIARYGGEEFVIILPETQEAEGVNVMMRVQRQLTKNFFLHDNQKVLITFSAGVAERGAGELPDAVIKRADLALYQAKHAGRNRVSGSGE